MQNTAIQPSVGTATEEFSTAEIRAALARVLASQTIAGSERLVQFLRFVVETKVHGNADHLKETIIGVSVFGRAPDYDPKADTIVRSQAWRLRAKLNEYYSSEGADDPLMIYMPRGCYVPVFIRRGVDATNGPFEPTH